MSHENTATTFDIIIIGAGTAGSLLASRLSSDSGLKILVLEAGENRNDDVKIRTPGLSGKALGNPAYDWQFHTLPEEGLDRRVIQQPRGKLWGGSSAINSHALVYPSKGYHDAWAELSVNDQSEETQWGWQGIKKYYKRFQNLQQPCEDAQKELGIPLHAKNDDRDEAVSKSIQASFPMTVHVLQKAWTDTIQSLGLNSPNDPVEGETLGGTTTANAIDAIKGERSHAGTAFLESAMKRENLDIRSNVMVEKIIFDESQKHEKLIATGVLYRLESGESVSVSARKEVILCAGTFGSPKILELSGIGGREKLTAAGVECIYDLPGVGENLQDHLNFGPSVEVHDSIETSDVPARIPAQAEANKQMYETKHRGPLAEGAAYSFSYFSLQMFNSSADDERQLCDLVDRTLQTRSASTSKGLIAQYKIIRRMIQDPGEATATILMTRKQRYTPLSEPAPGNYMTLLAMLSYPFSRGGSHIQSKDPSMDPEIIFNYLQHPLDAEILSRHMIQIGQLLKEPSLSACLKPGGNTLPSGFPREAKRVEDVKGYLRKFAATNYHPAGTCAMMNEELDGVVDATLKVYGTANVRVCDASIIPIIPRGNILSTVYALADKGSDILKAALQE